MSFVATRAQIVKVSDLTPALIDISAACLPGKTKYDPKSPRPDTTTLGNTAKRNQGVLGLREATFGFGGQMKITSASAAPIHGRNTVVLIDQYPLKSFVQSGSIKRQIDTPGTACLGETWSRHQVVGNESASMSLAGLYDSVASGIDARFRAMAAASSVSISSTGYNGFAVGQPVDLLQIVSDGFSVGGDQGGAVPMAGSFMSDDVLDPGVSLHDLTAETGTVNGASANEGAQTTAGWVAHLHVTGFVTFTNVTLKLQDSANDSVWADLTGGGFTVVTGTGGWRIESAAGATVRQYVRVIISAVTGAGSITFACAFGRRTYVSTTIAPAGTHRHLSGLLTISAAPTFSYGPEGSTAGKQRFSGSLRMSSYNVDFKSTDVIGWDASFVNEGAITEDTY